MKVLVAGAHGFIGRHLVAVLLDQGHEVIGAVRRPRADPRRGYREIAAGFDAHTEPREWLTRLAGVEVVINAAGIVRENSRSSFAAVHTTGPQALFRACAAAGVRRVIQISALGADTGATSRFHRSKRAADEALLRLPLDAVVVQPSLVFGADGASAQLFARLASLPLIPLPGRGAQRIQPIHVDDLVAGIAALVRPGAARGTRIALVGPQDLRLRDYLARLRRALHLGRARFVPVPMPLVRFAAACGRWLPDALLTPDTLAMLLRGNTADARATREILGRAPRPVEEFVPGGQGRDLLLRARLAWLLPLLRWSIAAVWIGAGVVSFGLYPVEQSYLLLERSGVPAALQPWALYGAAALDVAIGLALLILRRRRWLWLLQAAVIFAYSAVITWKLPEFWLHPYGPVLKNLPLLAATWLLYELEPDPFRQSRWTT